MPSAGGRPGILHQVEASTGQHPLQLQPIMISRAQPSWYPTGRSPTIVLKTETRSSEWPLGASPTIWRQPLPCHRGQGMFFGTTVMQQSAFAQSDACRHTWDKETLGYLDAPKSLVATSRISARLARVNTDPNSLRRGLICQPREKGVRMVRRVSYCQTQRVASTSVLEDISLELFGVAMQVYLHDTWPVWTLSSWSGISPWGAWPNPVPSLPRPWGELLLQSLHEAADPLHDVDSSV